MIKTFLLTMVFTTSNGGGGIATSDFPKYDDCQGSAVAYMRNIKVAPITYANAWCTVKYIPTPEEVKK